MTIRTKLDVYQDKLYATEFIGSLHDDAWFGIDMMFHFLRLSYNGPLTKVHEDWVYDLNYFSGDLSDIADLLLEDGGGTIAS